MKKQDDYILDEEKMQKIADKLEKMGMDKEAIDERAIWGAKKMFMGIMKLRWVMEEKGISQAKAKKIVKGLVDKAMDNDLKKMMEEKEEMGHKSWRLSRK